MHALVPVRVSAQLGVPAMPVQMQVPGVTAGVDHATLQSFAQNLVRVTLCECVCLCLQMSRACIRVCILDLLLFICVLALRCVCVC